MVSKIELMVNDSKAEISCRHGSRKLLSLRLPELRGRGWTEGRGAELEHEVPGDGDSP